MCPRVNPGAGYPWSVLYSMHLFRVSVSVFLPITVSTGIAPVPLGPSFSLVPWPSRLSAYVPSSLPFIPLSPLFSPPRSLFFFLLPPPSPSPSITPSPLFLLFFLCLSLSACLYINISLQHCRCLCSNNPISSQTTSQALKASQHNERPGTPGQGADSLIQLLPPPRRASSLRAGGLPPLPRKTPPYPQPPQNLGPHF